MTSEEGAATIELTADTIDAYLVGLSQQSSTEHKVSVDFKTIQVAPGVASLLSNTLVGSLGQVTLDVCGPDRHGSLDSALAFALANRSGRTFYRGIDPHDLHLSTWQRPWSVGQRGWLDLFSVDAKFKERCRPCMFHPRHAAFVNPHHAGPGIPNEVVLPWLSRLTSNDTFADAASRVVDELLDNVRQHAMRQENGELAKSLLQVMVSDGATGMLDVSVSVLDTGPGIVATARPKIESANLKDDEVLQAIIEGTGQTWHRGRGLGLAYVRQQAERWAGRLFVGTHKQRLHYKGNEPRLSTGFHLDGTVVVVTLCLPVHN